MKANRFLLGGLIAVLAISFPFLAMSFSGGAPSGHSGPEQTCNNCHGIFGDINTGTGAVTIIAPTTYTAGSTVSVTVEVDNTTQPDPNVRQGFMISARNGDGSLVHVGKFDLDGSTQIRFGEGGDPAEDSLWVTHTSSGNQISSWTFSWIAPLLDPPTTVTFYAAGNATNGDGDADEEDFIYTTTHDMHLMTVASEPDASPRPLSIEAIVPNPFRSETDVSYTLDRPGTVRIVLRDGRGRLVRDLENGPKDAGNHRLRISADGLASGVYFLTLYGTDGMKTRPLTISN